MDQLILKNTILCQLRAQNLIFTGTDATPGVGQQPPLALQIPKSPPAEFLGVYPHLTSLQKLPFFSASATHPPPIKLLVLKWVDISQVTGIKESSFKIIYTRKLGTREFPRGVKPAVWWPLWKSQVSQSLKTLTRPVSFLLRPFYKDDQRLREGEAPPAQLSMPQQRSRAVRNPKPCLLGLSIFFQTLQGEGQRFLWPRVQKGTPGVSYQSGYSPPDRLPVPFHPPGAPQTGLLASPDASQRAAGTR